MKEDDKGLYIFGALELGLLTIAVLLTSFIFDSFNVPILIICGFVGILIYFLPALKRIRRPKRLKALKAAPPRHTS